MTYEEFSKENFKRCQATFGFNHKVGDWSLSDWMVALAGEVGEAANIVKKLNRLRDGIPGNGPTEHEGALVDDLCEEVADIFIYLDLFAHRLGISMMDVVLAKFDKTSAKIGYRRDQA